MSALNTLLLAAFSLLAATLIAALLQSSASRADAAVELQLGPVIVSFGGTAAIAVSADHCLQQGCPLLEFRTPSLSCAAPQSPPSEPGRVQRLQPAVLQGAGFAAEHADDVFGEQGRVGEATSSETAQDQRSVKPDLDSVRR